MSLLVLIATPFIAGSQFFVLFDRVMHTNFFNSVEGWYVLGYRHIFWFYSRPAVYVVILPGFGIISEVVSVMSRKPIFVFTFPEVPQVVGGPYRYGVPGARHVVVASTDRERVRAD